MTLAVGSLLQDNRYQIQTVLNTTDVEVAYRATHTYLNRTVVLKQLRDDVDWSVDSTPTGHTLMARLIRLSQCQHPCLGQILDCFEENGAVYLVLPTYGDLTLHQWLQSNRDIPHPESLSYLRTLVDIFDKFHQTDIIYGQLTPHSIHYRSETNEMVVTDMGWRMFIADLLGDRHRVNYSKGLDIQGLAYIAYRLFNGNADLPHPMAPGFPASLSAPHLTASHPSGVQVGVQERVNPEIEYVIETAMEAPTAQSLTPTGWFTSLEQALTSPEDRLENGPEKSLENGPENGSGEASALSSETSSSVTNASHLPPVALDSSSSDSGENVLEEMTLVNVMSADSTATSNESIESIESIESNDNDEETSLSQTAYGTSLSEQRQSSHQRLSWKRRLPALLSVTSVLAAVSGGSLGYVFRTQDMEQLEQSPLFGSEIFGSEQEFPPSEHWPGSKNQGERNASVLFERSPDRRTNRISSDEVDVSFRNGQDKTEAVNTPPKVPGANEAASGMASGTASGAASDAAAGAVFGATPHRPQETGTSRPQVPPGNTNLDPATDNSAAVVEVGEPDVIIPVEDVVPSLPQKAPKPPVQQSPQAPSVSTPPPPAAERPTETESGQALPTGQVVPSVPDTPAETTRPIPTKKPKVLVAPITPPSVQDQDTDLDAMDVSTLIPPSNQL